MRNSHTTTYMRSKDSVFQEIDGVVHILDQKKDAIVTLNETATLLWDKLSKRSSLHDLTLTLIHEYSLNTKRANDDVTDFIHIMLKMGLVSKS